MIRSGSLRRLIKGFADYVTPLAPNYRNWELKNFLLRLSGLNIAKKGVAIGSGFKCIDGHEENIKIDAYAAIGHNVHLWNFNEIYIGKFCMIAADVSINNGWHDKSTFEPASGPVSIGSGCWIGVNVTIVGSVHIGENSIVAAGALVNKDVLPNSIVAGVPAKVIAMREIPKRVWHLNNIYYCPNEFKVLVGLTNE
jgi:acetyltransferase-like isoleucine patch superfamily enzyme